MIRSKFSFLTVYMIGIFLIGLFSLGVFFLFHPEMQMRNKFGSTNSALIPGLILAPSMGFLFCMFFRQVFAIRIEQDQLSIRNLFSHKHLFKNDIRSVNLLSREKFFWAGPYEGLTIELKDGQNIRLPDSCYRNMPELRRALQDYYGDLTLPLPVREKRKSGSSHAASEPGSPIGRFSGNYLTSLTGIMFYGVSIVIVLITWIAQPPDVSYLWDTLVPLPIISLCYIFYGAQLYYFNISEKCLEVKNHLFFWYCRSYPVEDILGVVLESPDKISHSLRIRKNDLDSRTFVAASLRSTDWEKLGKKLLSMGIHLVKEF